MDGKAPVLLRVTVNGFRNETPVSIRIEPDKWNAFAEKSMGTTKEDQEMNARIDTIRLRIMQIHRQMELDGVEITPRKVLDEYLGRNEKSRVMLLDFFREHNDRCRKLIGKDMTSATVERYDTCLKHTANFMKLVYDKTDIPLEEVNYKFIKDYEFYLKTERNCSHNTATKYLKNFKKITRLAIANDVITKDPFANIKFTLEEVERDFLEDHEIQILINKEISIPRLAKIRDIFVFCCFSGLAFSDVKGLRAEHLAKDNNNQLWIRKRRQKTNNMCNIPLLDIAKEILERYKDDPECKNGALLPVPTNQKMNGYLKEIATICGINKELSTHTARHSFATSVALANNVSIENVAKMLGHSDTKMTRHYARVLDKSILRDMKNVNSKFTFKTGSKKV